MDQLVIASPVAWMAVIVGLMGWMLVQPRAPEPWKVLALMLAFILEPFCDWIMDTESDVAKYDYFLQRIDAAMGFTAFRAARLLRSCQAPLFAVYQSLSLAMVLWYGVNLKTEGGRPRQLLIAYALAFGLAPVLYLIVPACGPRHAFGGLFPMGNPNPPLAVIRLAGWPNAIPSLHIGTAFLLVFFAGHLRLWRAVACAFAICTAASTLMFEHYVIDLVLGVAFACFVALAVTRPRRSLAYLVVSVTWLVAIRYGTPLLVQSGGLILAAAVTTLLMAGNEVRRAWLHPIKPERPDARGLLLRHGPVREVAGRARVVHERPAGRVWARLVHQGTTFQPRPPVAGVLGVRHERGVGIARVEAAELVGRQNHGGEAVAAEARRRPVADDV